MSGDNLESEELKRLRDFLQHRHATYVKEVKQRAFDGKFLAYIPSTSIEARSGKEKTSRRQMLYLKKAARKTFGIDLEFLTYWGELHEKAEEALRSLLKTRFSQIVLDCFVSFPSADKAEVWLELMEERGVVKQLSTVMEETIKSFLGHFNIDLISLHCLNSEREEPSVLVILRYVKILEPATEETIRNRLLDDGFDVQSSHWLRTKIDLLRKKGMVTYQEGGIYAVTEIGHQNVPHSRYRTSSDIERALALGRKRW